MEARLLGAGLLVPLDAAATTQADELTEQPDFLRPVVAHLDREPVPLLLYGNGTWPSYGWETLRPKEEDVRSSAHGNQREPTSVVSLAAAERTQRTAALQSRVATLTSVWAAARDSAAGELARLTAESHRKSAGPS